MTQGKELFFLDDCRNPPCPENVANSKLNPEAAEFVPSNRRAPQEIPATTSS